MVIFGLHTHFHSLHADQSVPRSFEVLELYGWMATAENSEMKPLLSFSCWMFVNPRERNGYLSDALPLSRMETDFEGLFGIE